MITPDDLLRPAEGPEIILQLGQRGMRRTAEGIGIYAHIMRSITDAGHVIRAVPNIKESRRAARADKRFHVFFHGRMTGKRFLNFKESYLKGYYYCDPKGFSGFSSISDQQFDPEEIDPIAAEAFAAELRGEMVLRRTSKYRQPPTETELPKNAIALFLQIQDDVVLTLARFTLEEILKILLQERGSRPLLIKRHPLCKDVAVEALLSELHDPSAGIHVTDANLHDIMAASDHVAVVNSGTGFEALIHDKPVLLFGGSDYHHAAFPIAEAVDVGAALAKTKPPAPTDRFLYWFLRRQMIAPRFGDMGQQMLQRIQATKWRFRKV